MDGSAINVSRISRELENLLSSSIDEIIEKGISVTPGNKICKLCQGEYAIKIMGRPQNYCCEKCRIAAWWVKESAEMRRAVKHNGGRAYGKIKKRKRGD